MKNIKLIRPLLLSYGAILILFSSCEIQEDFKYQPSNVDGKLDLNAWDYIQQSDSLSFLQQAITYAEVQSLFNGSEAKTYILPNNAAFRTYLRENQYSTVEDIPLPILRNILRYHTVKDRVIFTDPALAPSNRPIAYETENGQVMYLSHNSSFIGLINEGTNVQWQIRTSNLEPTNGVIHVVNSVVYYSAPTGEAAAPNPNLIRDTIYALHDSYVNGPPSAGTNFGTATTLRLKNLNGNSEVDRRVYLLFNFDDFKKDGIVTDMQLKIQTAFTAGKGVFTYLYDVPGYTDWTETAINFNTAQKPPAGTSPIASFIAVAGQPFVFDVTGFYNTKPDHGRVTFMLDAQAGSDETTDLASKEHPTLAPPMLIAILASGVSTLTLDANAGINVSSGGVFVLDKEVLEVSGAAAADIAYTVDDISSNGWLIKGANILRPGDRFTQLDIDLKNILFIHNGENNAASTIGLSARDRSGGLVDDISVNINVQ
ncbi:DNRLRE domain-containing protein [Sphingobacterium olei]|uniref:DNRLRE domain-containing protein n=1 Tax=Sphingobacterium olei TaxID=2571155 RepID=A0A4U0P4E8_9SPHI|nr:DNRLRE domain-containing protein [Sphingobacterium olei]TJZ62205.1 DNRLRE domain-containing protein [Sphingobacterium olei]